MKVVALVEFGGPEVLHLVEVEDPRPEPTQLVVRVEAATVNPTDTYLRSGQYAGLLAGVPAPWIPGMEAAGVVQAVGEAVTRVAVGDHVLAVVTPFRAQGGAYAERLLVEEKSVTRAPVGVDAARGVTLAMNGLTALRALDVLRLHPGDRLALIGATGVVGGYVSQLAVRSGLRLVDECSDADGLVDAAGVGPAHWVGIRPGTVVAALRPATVAAPPGVVVHQVAVTDYLREVDRLMPLVAAVADGEVTLPQVQSFPHARCADAHRLMGERSRPRPVLAF